LASRPEGIPAATNFTLVRTELEPLKDEEVLVRNFFMSADPYMRGCKGETSARWWSSWLEPTRFHVPSEFAT
jgi:hypothetical protein